jgi:ubiquinone/menaquinone biosynthesis C-methylase UbiE
MTDSSSGIIAEAFSRTAEKYDAFARDHPNQTRMRNKVYSHMTRLVSPGSHILELNCGTGTDALELAQRGYAVHATDIAPGMLDRLRAKVNGMKFRDRITMENRSFLSLQDVPGAPFDAVFSNLGGLNCIPDLMPVVQQLPKVLKPNGIVTWVLMSHVCLWEMAEILRGHPRLAFRRFERGAVRSHLEGLFFDVFYFSPKQAIGWFGGDFDLLGLEGLSVITPTAESRNFAKMYPRLYRALSWLDDRLAPHWPWNGWGDFYIMSFRYRPAS